MPAIEKQTREFFDVIFEAVLLLLCIVMVCLFIKAVFFSDEELLEKGLLGAFSGGGFFGVFYLYMKWRVLKLTITKIRRSPEYIDAELINSLSGLMSGIFGKGKNE